MFVARSKPVSAECRNIAQNILAVDCCGDFEAIRAVREAKADLHRRSRRQIGDHAIVCVAACAQRSLVRTNRQCRDEKKHGEGHALPILRVLVPQVARVKASVEPASAQLLEKQANDEQACQGEPPIARLRHHGHGRKRSTGGGSGVDGDVGGEFG